MKLIVISPESAVTREHAVLAELFAAGLAHYHLRKPAWSRDQLARWLRALPESFTARIVLHTHHDLATDFPLAGLHDRDHDHPEKKCHLLGDTLGSGPLRSRAVHDCGQLRDALGGYDRVLVSPVFPSISKPGHAPSPALGYAELKAVLALPRRAEVFALGGVEVARIPACREIGFDGVAVLGAVWEATDPVHAFHQLQDTLHAYAA